MRERLDPGRPPIFAASVVGHVVAGVALLVLVDETPTTWSGSLVSVVIVLVAVASGVGVIVSTPWVAARPLGLVGSGVGALYGWSAFGPPVEAGSQWEYMDGWIVIVGGMLLVLMGVVLVAVGAASRQLAADA